MRSSLFWDVTQRKFVIIYRRFGKTHQTHLKGQAVQEEEADRLSRNVGEQEKWRSHLLSDFKFLLGTNGRTEEDGLNKAYYNFQVVHPRCDQ